MSLKIKSNSILCFKKDATIGVKWFSIFQPHPKGGTQRTRYALVPLPDLILGLILWLLRGIKAHLHLFFFLSGNDTRF